MDNKQIAILWDIENVTPPGDAKYIDSIIDSISERGNVSYAMAFGDWTRRGIRGIAAKLAEKSFELIQIPESRKNSSDMSMITHGVELIFQYPHISTYVLITGDADFRPLLQSLRKYGKQTLIICNQTNASTDLLKMADEYIDYHDTIDDHDSGDDAQESQEANSVMPKEQAFQLLEETVAIMLEEARKTTAKNGETKKPAIGAVKIRMKLLNNSFDEKKLRYRTWKAFINDAIQKTAVRYAPENDSALELNNSTHASLLRLPRVFGALLESLPASQVWTNFNEASKNLLDTQRIDYRQNGYSQFKKLVLDAEKRGLVQVKNEGSQWFIKKIEPAGALR
ncbi:MAG: hypothetical protein Pg6C_09820 [Treponemataceae bacterium]|nr:MAG: hypothetical protein Pg6C_09820 [Treponemataceae bacterium]